MKYAIQVNGHPDTSRAAANACQFIKAALSKGHQVILVFFYYDGVFGGLRRADSAVSRLLEAAEWAEMAEAHQLDLVLCVSAAERRGLQANTESGSDGSLAAGELSPGFRTGGLGQWVDACLRCDRFVVFAA